MADLLLCVSCERHLRPGEARCPFCAAVAPAARPVARAPRGLSRAKLYALHAAALATTMGVAVACGGDTTTGTDASTDGSAADGNAKDGAAKDAAGDGMAQADAASDATADAGGNDASADVVEDDGWGPPPPPYGCVFPGGCSAVVV